MARVPAAYQGEVNAASAQYGVPGFVLADVLQAESAWNPRARHVNPPGPWGGTSVDRGIAQINSAAHPTVTAAEAYTPAYAIPWAAQYLAAGYRRTGSWRGAVAAYNPGNPQYAKDVLGPPGSVASLLAAASPARTPAQASGTITATTLPATKAAGVQGLSVAEAVPRYGWLVLGGLGLLLLLVALLRIL